MKFSYQWLNTFLAQPIAVNELAEKLTLAGLEVDSVEPVAGEFSDVVVGEIKRINKHPDADKLSICQVNVAEGEPLTIVCGATNIYQGMKVAVAKIGALLPGDFKIKKSKLRGQPSYGMMCSRKELGISEESAGLMDLPKDAPLGQCVREYLNLDDVSIDVDLTPNRADCLSIFGIAREVSAISTSQVKPHIIDSVTAQCQTLKQVNISSKEACPRYLGRLIKNVNMQAKTPLWMVERLRRSGLRSISVIVDITNYVLLELGQPMHAFDADQITGNIHVRMANEDEVLVLLDESKVSLTADTLVIADDEKALAMAGIMGGLDSSVTFESKNIFLESAYFTPHNIAGKARNYGLHTDSSHRYERGVDPELCLQAMEYATELIIEIAGGQAGEVVQADHYYSQVNPITLHLSKLNRVLGMSFEQSYVESVLCALNMKVKKIAQGQWEVSAPSYRFDMTIQEDLIEEIGRIYGYQKLPMSMPNLEVTQKNITESILSINSMKSILVDQGYHESIHYSFIDPKLDQFFFPHTGVTLQNPISQDMSVMRQSLTPGLLSGFKANLGRQQTRVRLFEEGVCFIPDEKNHREIQRIAGLAFGPIYPLSWHDKKEVDFYDVKGNVTALLNALNKELRFTPCEDVKWLHPGQSAYVYIDGEKAGVIGVVHPNVMKFMQIKAKAPVIFELIVDKINQRKMSAFESLSKFPAVTRDLAIVVDEAISAQNIIDVVEQAKIAVLNQVEIFDIYQGENLAEGKKSVALSLSLQDKTQTLTEALTNDAIARVLDALSAKVNAELR